MTFEQMQLALRSASKHLTDDAAKFGEAAALGYASGVLLQWRHCLEQIAERGDKATKAAALQALKAFDKEPA